MMLATSQTTPRRTALVWSVVLAACAPAELSGSDRAEGGIVDSSASADASLDGDATSMGETSSTNDVATTADVGLDTSEPDAKDGGNEDGADSCPPVTTASDFYVVPSGDAEACNTFSTIAAALQAARSSTAAQRSTIHLAAGTYSDQAEFPIDLRGGISLQGSGKDSILAGSGPATVLPPANQYFALSNAPAVSATILVGDPEKTSQISGVSIDMAPGGAMAGTEAIVCDRGNAATTPPSPNTVV